jgi:hypothetical protein
LNWRQRKNRRGGNPGGAGLCFVNPDPGPFGSTMGVPYWGIARAKIFTLFFWVAQMRTESFLEFVRVAYWSGGERSTPCFEARIGTPVMVSIGDRKYREGIIREIKSTDLVVVLFADALEEELLEVQVDDLTVTEKG